MVRSVLDTHFEELSKSLLNHAHGDEEYEFNLDGALGST
jgi:hypothetical protein